MQLDKLDQSIFICIFNFDKCHLSHFNVTIYTHINLLMLITSLIYVILNIRIFVSLIIGKLHD